MANEKNLKPCEYKLSQEEAKKGGKKSGETRRKKKLLREIAEAIGAAQAPEEVIAKMEKLGFSDGSKITLDEAMMMAQYGKAIYGNVQSANFIAEMKGEKIQRIEQVNIDDRSMSRLNEDFGFDESKEK
jgi:hypothetical protein